MFVLTDITATTHIVQTTVPLTSTEQSSIRTSTATTVSSQGNHCVGEETTYQSIIPLGCFSPIIILIPSTSSLSSPLQFRRNQDFYISSYLQLKCNQSLSTITQWTINNCTSFCSSPIQFGQMLVTTSNELYIPAKTLLYGTYQLTLTVSMTVAPHLTSSASAYLRITPSGITANLVQYGTSMITRGHKQNLLLDPGTFSVDPDATVFNASVSLTVLSKPHIVDLVYYELEL